MSAIFDELEKIDAQEGIAAPPWPDAAASGLAVNFPANLPAEVLSDFYDLREYIRIAGQRSQMRVLSITSSLSGEGASTIATALAFLLAANVSTAAAAGAEAAADSVAPETAELDARLGGAGGRETDSMFQAGFTDYIQKKAAEALIQSIREGGVLLVDANLHHPGIHSSFGLEAGEGLAEIIEQGRDWRQVIRCMPQNDLHIITAGTPQGNPADVVGSERLAELVASWRESFRYVILDTPAVLNYVDALALSALSDGVILVVRAGQTRWEVAQNAKRKLSVAQANLLGVALNRQ
ncbi:MAG TPA: CpsD/CapB family tyrosine-protein kinase [bacterium]|nr:CpsD/CapB family tyrosine-protein kinase [bacterium]HQJ64018.1 CpsD/CapB family tyrosine-protein kinase [bacterium]